MSLIQPIVVDDFILYVVCFKNKGQFELHTFSNKQKRNEFFDKCTGIKCKGFIDDGEVHLPPSTFEHETCESIHKMLIIGHC